MSFGFLSPRTLGLMSGQMSHPLSFHQTEKRSISRGLLFFLLIADVCSVSVQIITLTGRGVVGGKFGMSR